MNPPSSLVWPRWATSTVADAGDSTPAELDALGAHVTRCSDSSWFTARCAGDAVHGFLTQRLVTSLLIAAAAIGLATIWL